MNIVILFGTESGNAELVAEDVAESIEGHDVDVHDMSDFDPGDLTTGDFVIIICSTYGDGDLPGGAVPFSNALTDLSPDLMGLRYAVFGMGDRSYEATYSRGSEIIDGQLAGLGAIRIGEYGRHDASSREIASDSALVWAEGVVALADDSMSA